MFEEFKGQNVVEFFAHFPDDDACKAYLYAIKFKDGFTCPKCGHQHCWDNHRPFYKVCKNCRHAESATANTLFHKVKFGLRNAFYICFEMSCTTKSLSSIQMGKRLGIRQQTAWLFMSKVRKAMASSQTLPMEGDVEVDEFVVGQAEESKRGRTRDSKKKKAALAIEFTPKRGVKRVYIEQIEDYSTQSLRKIFDKHISKEAFVRTDGWTAYAPLAKEWTITQEESDQGKNFQQLHVIVSQIKSWLRTVPSHISKKFAQSYFDEYCFRINRSQYKDSIFHKLIERMTEHKTITCPIPFVT